MLKQLNWKCADHPSVEDCPDALVGRFGKKADYGLLIHDGGSSHVEIAYCPWCGTRLREEKAVQTRPPVHEIAGGDVVLWSVDDTVHIKTTDKHNGPVELNEHQAMELSKLLARLVTDG
jgi:hypothetical protein